MNIDDAVYEHYSDDQEFSLRSSLANQQLKWAAISSALEKYDPL